MSVNALACKAVTVSALKSIQYGRHNSTNCMFFLTHDSCLPVRALPHHWEDLRQLVPKEASPI